MKNGPFNFKMARTFFWEGGHWRIDIKSFPITDVDGATGASLSKDVKLIRKV